MLRLTLYRNLLYNCRLPSASFPLYGRVLTVIDLTIRGHVPPLPRLTAFVRQTEKGVVASSPPIVRVTLFNAGVVL